MQKTIDDLFSSMISNQRPAAVCTAMYELTRRLADWWDGDRDPENEKETQIQVLLYVTMANLGFLRSAFLEVYAEKPEISIRVN